MAAELDAQRFVGREAALAVADAALAGATDNRVLHVHGPGGVGKSALLREIERRAIAAGRTVVHLDGRLILPEPDALLAALAPAAADGSVLIVDEADVLTPLRLPLRDAITSVVPADGVVVLGGRRAPGREWFDGGLEQLSVDLRLRPLGAAEARLLLERYGVIDGDDVDALVSWAAGYPLALTVGATLRRSEPEADLAASVASTPMGDGLDDLIVARLGGQELAGVDPDVLDVACVAPAVDARLLAAVLPGRATRNGLAQLRALSVSEPLGQRTTLHRLVRSALRARLRDTDPERHRAIVLKVAAHIRQRALAEGTMFVLEMADLVETHELRVGFDPSTTHYPDRYRPGDLEVVGERTGAAGTRWFERLRRWADEEPHQVVTVRRASGELAALSVICMASTAPAWADDDIETGPVLAHARAAGIVAETGMMHDLIVLEPPDDPVAIAEVLRVGNAGAMAVGAVRNPRYIYVTSAARPADDGTESLGYQDVPELRRGDDEGELTTIRTDFGPDGAIGQLYGLILMEQQAAAPVGADGGTALALVAALRSFHDDEALAASPLAPADGDRATKAEAVRGTVREAIDDAFGDSAADQQLRVAIERAYLDPEGGHGIAQRELHMSRSSFYRHLQKARQQLADRAAS